jgi:cold-inducible RNA-binding protein
MTVVGGSPFELSVQVMIRNPVLGNKLTADEVYEIIIMNSKLYVGNMSFNTSEDSLRSAFGQFGTLTDVYIANDRETGRPRGFAFVTFSTEAESKAAIEKMNGVDLDGRQLTVNEARPKTDMGGAGGGGGGREFTSPNRRPGAFQARGNSRY